MCIFNHGRENANLRPRLVEVQKLVSEGRRISTIFWIEVGPNHQSNYNALVSEHMTSFFFHEQNKWSPYDVLFFALAALRTYGYKCPIEMKYTYSSGNSLATLIMAG